MTLKEALSWGREHLQGSSSAALDARVLLQHTVNLTPEYLLSHGEDSLSNSLFQLYSQMILRRAQGEPVAKIIGKKEFYGRAFKVSSHVLDPRPDSETLIKAVLENTENPYKPLKILEIGVGSGCLILTLLAELVNAEGIGVDISEEALLIAHFNAYALTLESRIVFQHSDLFTTVKGKFDIIISNPPYIPSKDIETLERDVKNYEPRLALDGGSSGLDFYQALADHFAPYLVPTGVMVLEVGAGQASEVQIIFRKYQTKIYRDLSHIERCLLVRF